MLRLALGTVHCSPPRATPDRSTTPVLAASSFPRSSLLPNFWQVAIPMEIAADCMAEVSGS